jgi:CelD/BcsL family acetyltransferase involved in cellulose biosynthesis
VVFFTRGSPLSTLCCVQENALQLAIYQGDEGFDALRGEWNALLRRSIVNQLFLTWEFQHIWWQHWGEGTIYFLTWRNQDELVGIVPLYVARVNGARHIRLNGGTEVADYLDLIVAPGYERPVVRGLLDWLCGVDAPAWDVLELVNVPEGGVVHTHVPANASSLGWKVDTKIEDVCPIIPLPGTWEEYLAMLKKHQRHEIRRKMRRIELETTVRWYIVDQSHDLEVEVDRFIRLHELSSPAKDAFMTNEMKRFFRALAKVMLEAGWLQLSFIEVFGEAAASMFCFDYNDSILVYNSGYDPHKYFEFSPGIVLLSYCIRHAIELGKRKFDFMQGDEEYKYRFGGQDTRVYRITATRPCMAAPS